jgi:two-component system sensor histidine kinase KdpD
MEQPTTPLPPQPENRRKSRAATVAAGRLDREREHMHRQMLSSVSHDLKTPLASVIGSLEIYERLGDKLTPEKKEILIATALQEAYRLDNFITNILDMARLENGAVNVRQESCNIERLIKDCLTRLGNRLKDTAVKTEVVQEVPEVITDPTLLTRAVCLLLDNAVKYGGTPPAIHITYGKDEAQQSFIRIQDNGLGIPDTVKDSIFSKYTRFSRQDRQNAGTGLGLAICREIMRLLQGRVMAENQEGGGAVFTLYFSDRFETK